MSVVHIKRKQTQELYLHYAKNEGYTSAVVKLSDSDSDTGIFLISTTNSTNRQGLQATGSFKVYTLDDDRHRRDLVLDAKELTTGSLPQ